MVKEEERVRWGHVHARTSTTKGTNNRFFHIIYSVRASSGSHQNLGFSPQQLGKMRMMLMEAISEKRLCAARGQLSAR